MIIEGQLTNQDQVVLKKIYAKYQDAMNREMPNDEGFSVAVDAVANRIVTTVKFSVYGINHPEQKYQYPENWVEAIKDRWLPQWARKRWPVKYRMIVVNLKELYPNAKAALPTLPVRWHIDSYDLPFISFGK